MLNSSAGTSGEAGSSDPSLKILLKIFFLDILTSVFFHFLTYSGNVFINPACLSVLAVTRVNVPGLSCTWYILFRFTFFHIENGRICVSFTGTLKRRALHYDLWRKIFAMYLNDITIFKTYWNLYTSFRRSTRCLL